MSWKSYHVPVKSRSVLTFSTIYIPFSCCNVLHKSMPEMELIIAWNHRVSPYLRIEATSQLHNRTETECAGEGSCRSPGKTSSRYPQSWVLGDNNGVIVNLKWTPILKNAQIQRELHGCHIYHIWLLLLRMQPRANLARSNKEVQATVPHSAGQHHAQPSVVDYHQHH